MRRVLNLYAGFGGNRKLWEDVEVTAVELDPRIAAIYQRLYPKDKVIVGDAHQYLLEHVDKFDDVWTSPPCPSHSRMTLATRHKLRRYADMKLYEEIIFLKHFAKHLRWVVENVRPYYVPLVPPTAEVGRHIFWSNFDIGKVVAPEQPKGFINLCNLKGKRALMDWLGIHFEENIYYGNNHCPAQVLRNCVHPLIGKQIFDAAMKQSNPS